MEAFSMEAVLKLNKSGYDKGLDDSENKGKSFGSKIGSSFVSIGKKMAAGITAGTVAAGAAIVSLTKSSISAASELEQGLGGTKAVFGETYYDQIVANSKEAYKEMGMSQSDYLATMNKMGSLFQGSGMSEGEAFEKSTEMMQRAADVASIMGIDVSDAMTAIEGAAKGNFTMMDNLGVAMNETTLEAYAQSKGIKKSYSEMSNLEKEQLAYGLFMEKTEKYAGNYAAENETVAGSISTLKAAYKNFLSDPSITSGEALADSLSSTGTVLAENIKTIFPGLVDGLKALIDKLAPEIPRILQSVMPSIVSGIKSLLEAAKTVLPVIIEAITGILPDVIAAVVEALPDILGALIDGIGILINEFPTKIWPALKKAGKDIWKKMLTAFPAIGEIVSGVKNWWNSIKERVQGIVTAVISWFNELGESISAWWERTKAAAGNTVQGVINWFHNLGESISAWWNRTKEEAGNTIEGVIEWVNKLAQSIGDWWESVKESPEGIVNFVLNLAQSIKDWWAEKWNAVKDQIKGQFGIEVPDWETTKQKIRDFWDGENGVWTKVKEFFKATFSFELPDLSETIQSIKDWWEGIKNAISDFFLNIQLPGWIQSVLNLFGFNGSSLGQHLFNSGEDGIYQTTDENGNTRYTVTEPEGYQEPETYTRDENGNVRYIEPIGPMPEAKGYEEGFTALQNATNETNSGIDKLNNTVATSKEIGAAVANAVSGMAVYLDGTLVGRLTAPTVSRYIAGQVVVG